MWAHVRDSFWFFPSLLALSSLGLYALTTWMDHKWPDPRLFDGWLVFQGGADAARELLSTLATSMMTVAGVVFSITIVVLTLAAAQLGPRLIPSFMGDAANQFVLGAFVATFIYCTLVLQRVYGGENGGYVPNISIAVSIGLAVINSMILIFYIHHISVAIQADQVINGVARDVNSTIEKMVEHRGESLSDEAAKELERVFDEKARRKVMVVCARESGYVQSIDTRTLRDLAVEVDGVFKLNCRPGDYKLPGTPLLTAAMGNEPRDDFADNVHDSFILGKIRTPEHDIEFSMGKLVEIALRALASSYNDPFTAITCVDKLSSALRLFADAEAPPYVYDDSGHLRLVIDQATFSGALEAAGDDIRTVHVDKVHRHGTGTCFVP